jgi:hypothetical protein
MYFGYCQSSRKYRMMDLPDYVSNVQEGISKLVNDGASAYQDMFRGYADAAGGTATMPRRTPRHHDSGDCGCGCRDCGDCRDCHCECCVSDADVLVHARCGELRRIPLTFENDTRRDRPVKLELGKFVTSGGRDLGWQARLSETDFTLRPCDEHTVVLEVRIRCATDAPPTTPPTPPPGTIPNPNQPAAGAVLDRPDAPPGRVEIGFGTVDECEVGYATIRAEGCLTRPLVVAVAVLPDDCDSYRRPCGCDCCCD